MVIYEWPGKFALVTEQRCGSSVLNDISEFEDSPLVEVEEHNLDEWISESIKTNKAIYVLCRDIHHKRSSAVNMMTNHNTCREQVTFINGMIHSFVHHTSRTVEKCKFFNFCLDDSHLDWGTSVYYHFLRSKGVTNLCLLWLKRPNLLETNTTIESLDIFLLFNFRDYPEIEKFIRRNSEELRKSYDHNDSNVTYDRLSMTQSELSHLIVNEAYNKAFRELTDHRHDVLKFSDWIWCEQFMNNTMISMYTSSGYDCPYTSAEVIDIVKEKLDILDIAEIKKREDLGTIVWWPGKRFMTLFSDVYDTRNPSISSHVYDNQKPLPAEEPNYLDNARKALTNT